LIPGISFLLEVVCRDLTLERGAGVWHLHVSMLINQTFQLLSKFDSRLLKSRSWLGNREKKKEIKGQYGINQLQDFSPRVKDSTATHSFTPKSCFEESRTGI
jgi:hypothetical protein